LPSASAGARTGPIHGGHPDQGGRAGSRDHRAARTDHQIHRLQSPRAVRHHRGSPVPVGLVGKEVPASTEVVNPPQGPEDADTPKAFVRHSAVMSVGTALSRLTGFLRVAAMAYALGVAESRLADAYNV